MLADGNALGKGIRKQKKRLSKNLSTKNKKLLDPLQYALSVHDDDLQDYEPTVASEWAKPTERQIEYLVKNGFDASTITCKGYANKVIDRIIQRKKEGLCSAKQMKLLQRYGYDDVGSWSFDAAQATIAMLASNGWRKPYLTSSGF